MPRRQGNKKGKAAANTAKGKGKERERRPQDKLTIAPMRVPRRSPTPLDDDDYMDITDVSEVAGPVESMVHERMAGGWKVNKDHPMWIIFDVINPVRQFKRGMEYDETKEFPGYGRAPWEDLTETDDPVPGWMPYAPIAHQ